MLEKMCNSIKRHTKKALLTGALLGSLFLNTSCSDPSPEERVVLNHPGVNAAASTMSDEPLLDIDDMREFFSDTNDIKRLFTEDYDINELYSEAYKERENFPLMTTLYGEVGYYNNDIKENPVLLNLTTSYNIFDKSLAEGATLLTGRAITKIGRDENFWNNIFDVGVGLAYQKYSFIVGVGGAHREALREKDGESFRDGDFFRLWGGYWDMWELKELESFETFPNRVWGTHYLEFDYNTLEENLRADFRTDVNLDLLALGDVIFGFFGKAKINGDTNDEPYYRYWEYGGGLRIRKGPFSVFLETGERKSLNEGGSEGSYSAIYGGVWIPIYH